MTPRVIIAIVAMGAAFATAPALTPEPQLDLLASVFLAPERQKLESGAVLVRMLPSKGPEITLACAVRVDTDLDRLMAWARTLDEYKRGHYVPATGRFSEHPQLSDLDALELGQDDLKELRHCQPGDCGLKLASSEIQQVHDAAERAGRNWQPAVQQAFRQIVLGRAQSYLAAGLAGALPYDDKHLSTSLNAEFAAILMPPGFMTLGVPALADWLLNYPRGPNLEVESYLYWSVESLGRKPIVAITHVTITRPAEPHPAEFVVAAKNVFATHYLYGGLSVTAVSRPAPGVPPYLIYLNRARVDTLGGPLGGLFRHVVEGRIHAEAPAVLLNLRRHLEAPLDIRGTTRQAEVRLPASAQVAR